jgi:hypothetical protein
MIASGILNLFGQVIGIFGAKGAAKQEALKQIAGNMHRSWTDEVIVCIWFSAPLVAWFDSQAAIEWIQTVSGEKEYFALLTGITAAVFGLGKINGK